RFPLWPDRCEPDRSEHRSYSLRCSPPLSTRELRRDNGSSRSKSDLEESEQYRTLLPISPRAPGKLLDNSFLQGPPLRDLLPDTHLYDLSDPAMFPPLGAKHQPLLRCIRATPVVPDPPARSLAWPIPADSSCAVPQKREDPLGIVRPENRSQRRYCSSRSDPVRGRRAPASERTRIYEDKYARIAAR